MALQSGPVIAVQWSLVQFACLWYMCKSVEVTTKSPCVRRCFVSSTALLQISQVEWLMVNRSQCLVNAYALCLLQARVRSWVWQPGNLGKESFLAKLQSMPEDCGCEGGQRTACTASGSYCFIKVCTIPHWVIW